MDELVDPYQVASSIELEKKSNFFIAKNTYVYIDIDELNDILSISEHTKFDEAEKIN